VEVTTRAGQSTRRRDVFGSGGEGLKSCGCLTVVIVLDTEVDGVEDL
jgi:hypothetical protein